MFSTTTTEASTNMPSAMARPPRLIRLAVRPAQRISKKVVSSDKGSETATTSAARRPPKKTYSTTHTSTLASARALTTVLIARETSSPRL